jgi:hypothetical protein
MSVSAYKTAGYYTADNHDLNNYRQGKVIIYTNSIKLY